MNQSRHPNLNSLWGALTIEELFRNGVEYFCIAPGSRSAPLTAAAALNKRAKTFVHFDERGLAFHALGFVSATRKPAALICTSGTAVANFFPAIIESSPARPAWSHDALCPPRGRRAAIIFPSFSPDA